LTPSTETWVLIADANGGRIFSFVDKNGEWTLRETLKGDGSSHPDQTADFGPKVSEHKGALHAHGEPDAKETRERRFAHTLAHVLERGHGNGSFTKLVLVASPKLLGDLRENLNTGLRNAVVCELHKDYTHSGVEDLMKLIRPELKP
jgi:protein required for attachment to host cells